MQHPRGLPPRPSLPVNPPLSNHARNVDPQQQVINAGAMAAQALTYSLANPYGQTSNYHSYTNANYYSYFTPVPRPMTTAQGYTLSSTYVPSPAGPSFAPHALSRPTSQRGRTPQLHSTYRASRPFAESSFPAFGDNRCAYNGCLFRGSKKTVEIHMMDRHLIFPPGWKKQQNGWDADPSLKGKPVPIPGTGVILNTPEAIDAWLAERKKRWPSNRNVEDKKRKAREAAERGEIDPSELTSKRRKRSRFDEEFSEPSSRVRGRGRTPPGRGWGSTHGLPDSGWRGRGHGGGLRPSTKTAAPANLSRPHERINHGTAALSSSDESTSESDSDVDPVRDAVSSKVCDPDFGIETCSGNIDQDIRQINQEDGLSVTSNPDPSIAMNRPSRKRKPVPQPRGLLQNPFASRPSLLRNLLLPEIRHTVSNLSQAIHFLVENDFLEGVELTPGDADSQRIKVIRSASFEDESDGTIMKGTKD